MLGIKDQTVSEEEAKTALSNPAFCKILSFAPMFEDIKNNFGINLWDYDSLDDYIVAVKEKMEIGCVLNGNL